MTCKHTATATGPETGYSNSVATPGRTDENRAAHGCITYTETCSDCGAARRVNQNQLHIEVSAWGPSIAEQRAADAARAGALRAGTDAGYRAWDYEYHVRSVADGRVTIQRLKTQPLAKPELRTWTLAEWDAEVARALPDAWMAALGDDVRVLRAEEES
jgi:hypothetical protein